MNSFFLFGATSIAGYHLFLQNKNNGVVPFCNPFTQDETCHEWPRIALEEESAYKKLFSKNAPQLLIHCGGVCDVEKTEKNPDWAHAINVQGTRHLLNTLPTSTRLVYVSSDHVFGGDLGPYDESSSPHPISAYGRLRVQAEQLVLSRPHSLVLRFGLAIGKSLDGKTGHLDWLTYRHQKKLPITIIEDEYRSVVWAKDVANRIMEYARSSLTGLRHISATRCLSRLELARALNRSYQIGARLQVSQRHRCRTPHLGRVELKTRYNDSLSSPLPAVLSSYQA